MSEQPTFEMYIHLYGKTVRMDDRFESIYIWSEELALKNRGRWIPQEVIGKKQTAVQLLIEQINPYGVSVHQDLFEQALQMERDQNIGFAKKCLDKALDLDVRTAYSKVERYYKETYGGQDE